MLYEYDVLEYVACMIFLLAQGVGISYFYNLKTYVGTATS